MPSSLLVKMQCFFPKISNFVKSKADLISEIFCILTISLFRKLFRFSNKTLFVRKYLMIQKAS